MNSHEHPLSEPLAVRPGLGLRWYAGALLIAGIATLLGWAVGFQSAGLVLLGAAGFFEWADAIRRWRLGIPSRREVEAWAATTRHHLVLRLMKEQLRKTDPEWSVDGPWHQQRLQDDSEDRRNLLYLLYLTAPPWSGDERRLGPAKLEDRRLGMLRSRLTPEVDPLEANGESNRILDAVKQKGLKLWPLILD